MSTVLFSLQVFRYSKTLKGLREVVEQKCQWKCQDGIRVCGGMHSVSVYHTATRAVESDNKHEECLTVACRAIGSNQTSYHQAHSCSDSLKALCKIPNESDVYLLTNMHTWQESLRDCESFRNSTLAPAVNGHKLCSTNALRNDTLWINGFKGYINTSTLMKGNNFSRDSVRKCTETRFTSTYNASNALIHDCFGVNRNFICESETTRPLIFTYHNETMSWHMATAQCVSKGGRLAKLTPDNKQSLPRLHNKTTIWNRELAIFTSWLGVFGCYRITGYEQTFSLSADSQNSYTAQCYVKCRRYNYLAVQQAACVCFNHKLTRKSIPTACNNICRVVDIPHTCGGLENFYNVFQIVKQDFHITNMVLTKQCLSEQCKSTKFGDVQLVARDCDTTTLKYFCEKNIESRDEQTWTNSLDQCYKNNSHLQFLYEGPCVKGTMKVGHPYWIGLFREPYYFATSDSNNIPKEDHICTCTKVDSNKMEQYSVNCSSKLPFVCEYSYIPTPASSILHPETSYDFHQPSKELSTKTIRSSSSINSNYNETIDIINSYISNNSSETIGSNFKNPYYSTEHQYNYEITDLFQTKSLLEFPEISSSNTFEGGIKPSYWMSSIEFETKKTNSSIHFSTLLSDSLYQTRIMQDNVSSKGLNHTEFYNATPHEHFVAKNSEIDEDSLKMMSSDTHMNNSRDTFTLHKNVGSMNSNFTALFKGVSTTVVNVQEFSLNKTEEMPTLYSSVTYLNTPENAQSHLHTVDLIKTLMPSQTTFASGTVSFINNAPLPLVIRTDKLNDTGNLESFLIKSSMSYLDDLLITSRYESGLDQYSNFISHNNELMMSDPMLLSSENLSDTLSEFSGLGDKVSPYSNLLEISVTSSIRSEYLCTSSIAVDYPRGISSASSFWQSSLDEVVFKETEENPFPFQSTVVYTTSIPIYPITETSSYSGNASLRVVPGNESGLISKASPYSYFQATEMILELTTLESSFMEIEFSPAYSTQTLFVEEIISSNDFNIITVKKIQSESTIANTTSKVNEDSITTPSFANDISTNILVTKFSFDNNMNNMMVSSGSEQVLSASSSSTDEYAHSSFEVKGTNKFTNIGNSEVILIKSSMPEFLDSLMTTSGYENSFDLFSKVSTDSNDLIMTSDLILFSSENPSDTSSEFRSSGDKISHYSILSGIVVTSLARHEHQYSSPIAGEHGMSSASSFRQSSSKQEDSKETAENVLVFQSTVVYTASISENPIEETSSYSGNVSWRFILGNESDLIPNPSPITDSYFQTTEMILELTTLDSSFTEVESSPVHSTRTMVIEEMISSDNFYTPVLSNIRYVSIAVNTTSKVNEEYITTGSFANDISTSFFVTKSSLDYNMSDIMVSSGSEQVINASSSNSIDGYAQSSFDIKETNKLHNNANSENVIIKSSLSEFLDSLVTKSGYESRLDHFSNLLTKSNGLIMTSNFVLLSSENPSDSSSEFSGYGDKMSHYSNLLEISVISMNRSELQYSSAIAVDNTRGMSSSSSSFCQSSSDEVVSEERTGKFHSFESTVVYTRSMTIYPMEETTSYSGNASWRNIPGNGPDLTSEASSLTDSYLPITEMILEKATPDSSFMGVKSSPLYSSRSLFIGEIISSDNFYSPLINDIHSMSMAVNATSREKEKSLTASSFANDISSSNLLIKFSHDNNIDNISSGSEQVIRASKSPIGENKDLSNNEIRGTDSFTFQKTAIIESSNFLHSTSLPIMLNEHKQNLTLYKQSNSHLQSVIDSYSNIETSYHMPTFDDLGMHKTFMENLNDKSITNPDSRSSINVVPTYSDYQSYDRSSLLSKTPRSVADHRKPTETKHISVSSQTIPSGSTMIASGSPMLLTSSAVYDKHLVNTQTNLLSDEIYKSEINTKIFIKTTDSPRILISSTKHSAFIMNTQIHLRSDTIYDVETATRIIIKPTHTTKTVPTDTDTDKMSRSWNRNTQLIVVATAGVVIAVITLCCVIIRIRYFREAKRKERQRKHIIQSRGDTASTVPGKTFTNRIYYEDSV